MMIMLAVCSIYVSAEVQDMFSETCASGIYPINIYTTTIPDYDVWRVGLVGQYPAETSEAAGLIRFAVDYINLNTTILPNVSISLYVNIYYIYICLIILYIIQ